MSTPVKLKRIKLEEKDKKMDKKCENCVFYEPFSDEEWIGVCHFNPPAPMPEHKNIEVGDCANFPEVNAEEWCGKFERNQNDEYQKRALP